MNDSTMFHVVSNGFVLHCVEHLRCIVFCCFTLVGFMSHHTSIMSSGIWMHLASYCWLSHYDICSYHWTMFMTMALNGDQIFLSNLNHPLYHLSGWKSVRWSIWQRRPRNDSWNTGHREARCHDVVMIVIVMKLWRNDQLPLHISNSKKKRLQENSGTKCFRCWPSAGEAFEGWWPLGGGERGGPRWGRTHGFRFLDIASVGFGDVLTILDSLINFWWCIFLIHDFLRCRGLGVISIFPYDWSLEEQDSFARMSPRNPAGPAPLSSSSGSFPGEEGIQPEADAWHPRKAGTCDDTHRYIHRLFKDFYTSAQFWLVINCHSQD